MEAIQTVGDAQGPSYTDLHVTKTCESLNSSGERVTMQHRCLERHLMYAMFHRPICEGICVHLQLLSM